MHRRRYGGKVFATAAAAASVYFVAVSSAIRNGQEAMPMTDGVRTNECVDAGCMSSSSSSFADAVDVVAAGSISEMLDLSTLGR